MRDFIYQSPTKIIFGKGGELKTGQEIAALGRSRVMIHYGGASAERSGLLNRLREVLRQAGLSVVELGGVVPNARLEKVYEGIKLGLAEGVDFVLGVGGGSVIDSAKSIAVGLANPQMDIWDIYERREAVPACADVGCVVTIPAAGSEFSQAAVLTNEATNTKKGYASPLIRLKFSVLNPELTYSLPARQTAAGVVDIMMHTMDKYLTVSDHNELSDALSEALLRVVIKNGPVAVARPDDYEARSELLWAGALSQNDILGLGAVKDSASHQIEHELSGLFDVTHGAGLAAIWGSLARYVYQRDVMRFCQYAVNVWGCPMDYRHPETTAMEGIARTEAFFSSLGMPVTIGQLGVGHLSEEQIEEMADKCVHHGRRTVGALRVLDKNDVIAVYNLANH